VAGSHPLGRVGGFHSGPEHQSEGVHPQNGAEDAAQAGAGPALAAEIPSEGEDRVAVFNALSFPRSGWVEVEIGAGEVETTARVVEVSSGREVPSRHVSFGAKSRIRFHAEDVPALGYRSYRIVDGENPAPKRGIRADAERRVLENEFYRLILASNGSLAGLWDKELERELLDTDSPYRGNQFIFKNDAWEDASPQAAEIRELDLGAPGAGLEARAEPVGIFSEVITRYTLVPGLKRVEIQNRFTKQPGKTASNETVFYAFPFAVPDGKFHLDIPGVVARYPEDFRPETDWSIMPAQSFAAVASGEVCVLVATREAPNFEFSAMRKFFDHPAKPDLSTTTLFAQPLTKQTVNRDDYDRAGGSYVFHYAITSCSGPFDAARAVRRAAAFQSPLRAVRLTRREGRLPNDASLLETGSRQVLLSALKPADDGPGLIVRLWNPTDAAHTARLTFAGCRITTAAATDALERDLGRDYELRDPAALVPGGPKAFVTLRVELALEHDVSEQR
jgi:alpha-mannosidase